MEEKLKQLDRWVYRAEKAIVVGSLVVMSIVVFLDVVFRTFASEENKFVAMILKNAARVGSPIEPGSATHVALETYAPYFLWVAFTWAAYFGIRTASRDDMVPPLRAAAYGLVGVVASYGLVQLMIKLLPNGLFWSKDLALVLTIWVGFVGASMCTYERKHLKVEAVQRFLPAKARPYVAFVAGLLTAAVCLILVWLALRILNAAYHQWVKTEGHGALVAGIDMPKFLCFAAVPIAFAVMAARFVAQSVSALRGNYEDVNPLAALTEKPSPARPPSDVPTEVTGRQRPATDLPQSEIPTEAVAIEDVDAAEPDTPKRQSEIPTDPHEIVAEDSKPSGEDEVVADGKDKDG